MYSIHVDEKSFEVSVMENGEHAFKVYLPWFVAGNKDCDVHLNLDGNREAIAAVRRLVDTANDVLVVEND